MRKTIITTIIVLVGSLSLFSQNTTGVRYDGLYQSEKEEYSYFLRFYPDNTVISVTSTGGPIAISEWFKQPYYNSGSFKISGKKISFECTSEDGTVVYKGKIKPNDVLELKYESLINGHKSKNTYKFVKL